MLSCAFFSGVASVWPFSHKAWICEVLQRLLSFWQVLPSQPRNSVILLEWSLGSWSLPWPRSFLPGCLVWLDCLPALGRVWVVPYSFHFLMMELTVLLGTFNTLEIALYPSPDLCLLTILYQSYTDSSLDIIGEFLLWHALSTVGPNFERCVSFQIMSNQLNWPQVDSNQVVETSEGWSKEIVCTWAHFGVSYQRGWILLEERHFSFSFSFDL